MQLLGEAEMHFSFRTCPAGGSYDVNNESDHRMGLTRHDIVVSMQMAIAMV